MNISNHLKGSFRLFDTAIFMKRFDVLDSPTGIFTDLTWELSNDYMLPRISTLSKTPYEIDIKAAWHERGLFFQSECAFETEKPFYYSELPKLTVWFAINCRHAPGIQRATGNCTALLSSLDRTNGSRHQSNGFFKWVKINRAKELSPSNIDTSYAPTQLEWIEGDLCKLKCFIGTQCLPNFNPVEFPEIAFDFSFDPRFYVAFKYGNTYDRTGSGESPSHWCIAKLIDK